MFAKMPGLPFEVIDGGISINARTDWGTLHCAETWFAILAKVYHRRASYNVFWCMTFLNARDMNPEALSGALNVIMYTINPQWLENLFGSPLRQLEHELCYGISPSAASFFPVFRFENFILLLSLAFNYSL
jgi:hypothetical protein